MHISYDYPDSINASKTPVIKDLVEVAPPGIQNECISLNRIINPLAGQYVGGDNVHELAVFGLPLGLNLRSHLKHASQKILSLDIDFSKYELIYAHKLSFEGYIARQIHEKHGLLYVVGIMQTDFKVLRVRPDLKRRYEKILECAAGVTIAAHWLEKGLEGAFGTTFFQAVIKPKLYVLPYICKAERVIPPGPHNGKYVCVTAMKRNYYKIKNFERLLQAVKHSAIYLDIYGYGDEMEKVAEAVERLGISDRVALKGPVQNENIQDVLCQYKAFVMPSYPETFGLVYIESLLSGIPILLSHNTALDGYFNSFGCQVAIDHSSVDSIAHGLAEMERDYVKLLDGVERLQNSGMLSMFSKKAVGDSFATLIQGIIK